MNDVQHNNQKKHNNGFAEPWNIKVTPHAIRRYQERGGNSMIGELSAASRIRNIVANGKEYVIKDSITSVRQLLNHDCRAARYFKEGNVMVVLEDDVVVTVHLAEAARWKPKDK